MHCRRHNAGFNEHHTRRHLMAQAKAAFNWEDPFLLDHQLSEDERQV